MKDVFREHEQQLEAIILHYGEEHQKAKAHEEMEELSTAMCAEQSEDVAEEIADVYIMLAQMMLIYDIPLYLIDSLIKYKLDRTIYRITQEEKLTGSTGYSTLEWRVEPIPNTSEKCIVGKLHGTDGTEDIKIRRKAPLILTKEEKTHGTHEEL